MARRREHRGRQDAAPSARRAGGPRRDDHHRTRGRAACPPRAPRSTACRPSGREPCDPGTAIPAAFAGPRRRDLAQQAAAVASADWFVDSVVIGLYAFPREPAGPPRDAVDDLIAPLGDLLPMTSVCRPLVSNAFDRWADGKAARSLADASSEPAWRTWLTQSGLLGR